jgi:hypothetical protein
VDGTGSGSRPMTVFVTSGVDSPAVTVVSYMCCHAKTTAVDSNVSFVC